MQQNDDILPQESAGASTPVAQGDTPTIQPVANARPRNGRSLSIAAPGQTASVGLLQVGQQGLVTTAPGIVMSPHTVARPGVSGTQAVVMSSQAVTRLLSPPISLPLQLPTALNVLQRQLSAPGIVSLSSVSAQDLHQVLQQVTQQSITLLTADSTTTIASDSQRPRVARPLSFPLSIATSQLPSVTSSVSATGGTIHHHGQNPLRGAVSTSTVQSNLHQSLLSVSLTQQQQQALAQRRAVAVTVATTATTPLSSSVMSTQSTRPVSDLRTGQSTSLRSVSSQPPRKKIKIEEKPAPSQEIANFRKLIIEAKHKEMLDIKANYFENLTEMFFLQNGGNLMDYHVWKKRPTPQLVSFLKSGNLDSDDEEDVLQVKEINSEVKVLTNPGSNVPLATPVAISTTLPPLVSALNQQGSSALSAPSSHRTNTSTTSPAPSSASDSTAIQLFLRQLSAYVKVIAPTAQAANAGTVASTSTTPAISLSSIPSLSSTSNVPQLQLQLSRAQDSKSPASKSQLSPSKHKSPPLSPGQRLSTRQQSLSAVYDQISGGSQEVIVERAKQEAQVMQRVAELRKEGLWSSRRLPRVQEPPRQKAHWDYLLEEMTWLAADFVQERKWKKAAARKLARMVSNYFKEQEQKELRAEKEEAIKLRKIASHMAKMVKEFWTNIEKVVQFKQQTRLEEKKKKALDLHLNFIVDQTEKYSTWLTEGLQSGSISGSLSTSPIHSSDGGEFEPKDNTSDDEETIEKEEIESGMDESETKKELEDLAKDGELPLEDLLKSLPEEVLATPAPLPDSAAESSSENEEKSSIKEESDEEFAGDEEDASDLEDTIAEQEIHEKRNYKAELDDLQAEGEMSLEELAAKYAGAYDSDFELPENDSSSEEEEGSASDSDDFEIETESSSEEETNLDEDDKGKVHSNLDDLGLQALIRPTCRHDNPVASTPQSLRSKTEEEEEFNDIAAQALSLQPKGNTLETTEVKTKVPFLLKHSLREYQHVGLDWLATMHEKRLNGILADEMGLGKTIQTIALLAHLACEKGIWGPHLIVVPTSVMLNWEMELKKWCPSFKILTYYGNQKERKLKRQGWTKTNAFHVCITSYKLVVQDHQAFRRKKWKYLILDEAQNIKNFKSQRWQMLLNFQSQRRLLLTGTPLQNSLMELWSLMHFLMPNVFQSHRDFKEWFSNPLTGMIEGSQEYNESLIKRLHKVLRPFLLRRLKNEVEKQMPKKYEHVVMCHLSKRQRFLYDDFMSQTKTKETLATGHYMSVINILMQLRKVCNHPNLFDPRPIISPFLMEGLIFHTASIVTHVLEHDPFKHISMRSLFPCLAEMERDLPAFVSHRVKQLKTSNNLIEEIDTQPDQLPRPPPGQLKPVVFHSVSPASVQNSSQASPASQSQAQAGSPVEVLKAALLRSPTPPGLPQSPPALPPKFGVVSHVSTPIVVQSIPQAQPSVSTAVFSPAISGATFTQVRTSTGQTLLLTSQARGGSPALVFSTMGQAPSMSSLALTTSTAPMTSIGSITTNTLPLQATLQAKVLPQQVQSTLHTQSPIPTSMLSSQPITVQIQQTEQGTRLMIPTGQLSQLPAGIIQLVQTSTGQQLFATASALTSTSQQIAPSLSLQTATSTASSTVCNPAPTTTAATSMMVLVTTAASHLKTIPVVSTSASAAAISPPSTTPPISSPQPSKPVMRVSPMVATATAVTTVAALPGSIVTSMVVSTVASGVQSSSTQVSESKTTCISVTRPVEKLTCSGLNKKSELYMATVHERRQQRRIEKLRHLAQINSEHCSQTPVYGPDVRQALSLATDLGVSAPPEKHWHYQGHANCQCAHAEHSKNLPKYYWHETTHLADIIHTPEQYLDELKEILNRFVFAAPTVIAPVMKMRVAHPGPSNTLHEVHLEQDLKQQLLPLSTRLNFIQSRQTIQFPELRLIQYDCGKLQTMDILLRKLKSESHRVLIFTQMTRMLDVLEAFLNYHGHRYLRLDGTTRVEQRQALMERFNADKRIFCFILSTRSGGIGVNLTGADTVIFYDSDWNPTMDAQAQDRCHRIGQTRDVHIYRLISEMTVEENILKKANQKRLLGDLAIEGGNFTTAFFKEQTIKDLFEQPSGLKALAEQKRQKMEADEKEKVESEETEQESEVESGKRPSGGKTEILAMFEQALCKAEDETDAMAATLVKAEQKAELAEFDESIPWDEREAEIRKEEEEMSKAEMELAMLDKELTPIERYAVTFVEMQNEDEVSEELKMAEEDIENSKKDWELARLKALKEEEERRAEMEDDEMLYTYLRDDAQTFVSSIDGSEMPLWAPPTPPQDDNDVYMDQTLLFLYEPNAMAESQLPPVYVRKEHKKPRVETITTRKQKQRKEEAPRVPRSLFDRPTAALLKMRRELKMQKLKAGLMKPFRPTTPIPPGKPVTEQSEGHPEWLIHEDWALLQAVQTLLNLPLNLTVVSPAHIPNWDLVAEVVNSCSRVYRSVKQCKARYENVIIPREEGRILYDVSPRKQKKTKGIYKTKNNRPMKTSQLYSQDSNSSISLLYSLRFDSVKSMAAKRPATMRQTLNNPTLKNPKHAAVLQENGINYDLPLHPMQVAANRAERIAREKKQSQQAAAAAAAAEQVAAQRNQQQPIQQAQQGVVQGVTGVAASAPTVAQAVTGQLHSLVSATPTTLIQTGAASKMAVAQGVAAVTLPRTITTTGNIVAVTGSLAGVRGQRAVAVHEITTMAGGAVTAAQVVQARAMLQSTTSSAGLSAQLGSGQKVSAITGASALAGGKTTVHQQLAAKTLTPQQINLLRPIVRSQNPQAATQAQQVRAQKLSFTLQATQILPGQMQQVGQTGATSQAPVTLVKSVTGPTGASAIPVSINVSMNQGQQKTGTSRTAVSQQLQQQQRMQLLHQQRKTVPVHQKVTALAGQARSGQIPVLIPQQAKLSPQQFATGHLLHQFVKQQQIIHTSPSSIIAAVTQGQNLSPMVAKVSLTTVPQTSQVQTMSAAVGTPITVTQVSPAISSAATGGNAHSSSVTTINMAGPVQTGPQVAIVKAAAIATVDAVQPQQLVVQATAPKMAPVSQSLVTQPLQLATNPVTQQQSMVPAGTQHRIISTSSAITPGTAVVVSTAGLTQVQQTTPVVQHQQSQQQQPLTSQLVTASVVSGQTIQSAGTMPNVISQSQQQVQQLTAQQQQQLQKASPYAMRSRNPPKH